MFSHPATVLGFIVTAIGWFMLATGGASSYELAPRGIVNIHSLWIASGLIITGSTLIVGGIVAGAAGIIRQTLLFHPQIAAGDVDFQRADKLRKKEESEFRMTGKKPTKEAQSPVDPEEALARTLREKGLK